MKVRNRRRLFEPDGQREWLVSHASVPFAYHLHGDRYRVYFGVRNEQNHTQPGYVELRLSETEDGLEIASRPVLETGATGTFDEIGIWPSWIVDRGERLYLYYNGWMSSETVPYQSTIGVAASTDGGETFERVFEGPILGRSRTDPYITGSPCVQVEDGLWRMWYLSAEDFYVDEEGPMYRYRIKYAESEDGLDWEPHDRVCIPFEHEGETRIARPCVRKDEEGYEMWYSYAIGHGGYRLGYATSSDGYEWERRDDLIACEPSATGWDSEMIAYPCVFTHDGRRYLLYNGNDYGRTGFGIGEITDE